MKEQYDSETQQALDQAKSYFKAAFPSLAKRGSNAWPVDLFDDALRWACDQCLNDKKAIAAAPMAVHTSAQPPFHYWDIEKECRSCSSAFSFSKETQKKWYEGYKFPLGSEEVYCAACRVTINQHKADNKRTEELLHLEREKTTEELLELAEIYNRFGNEQRANEYRNKAAKKSR